MLNVIKVRKARTVTLLTTYDQSLPIPIDTQNESLVDLRPLCAKMMVIGPFEPPKAFGLQHVKSSPIPPISNLLRTYMMSIPGVDTVVLSSPDISIVGDFQQILKTVEDEGFEASWSCHQAANVFIMSSPVVAYLMGDMPPELTFRDNWKPWVHNWMKNLLRQRYLDVTKLGVFSQISTTTDTTGSTYIPEIVPEEPKKRAVVRRVKAPRL